MRAHLLTERKKTGPDEDVRDDDGKPVVADMPGVHDKPLESGVGTGSSTEEPAVFRPLRPSPTERFSWRDQTQDDQAGGTQISQVGSTQDDQVGGTQDDQVDGHSHGSPTSCPLPDCAKEAEHDGSVGSYKKMPVSNTMMQAYNAMRAGVNGVVAGPTEPLLARLYSQELVQELGAPQMVEDINHAMNPFLPDNLNRPELYYYDRLAVEKHLSVPTGYGIDEKSPNDERKSIASAFGGQPNLGEPSGQSSGNDQTGKGKDTNKDKGKCKEAEAGVVQTTPADYDPFILDAMVSPGSEFPFNPHFDDGWVSDDEGHPDMTRISPCTFARWAAGCGSNHWNKESPKKPVIPSRSSSLGRLEHKQPSGAPLIETPPRPPPTSFTGFDAVQAVKDISALKRKLNRLASEKKTLGKEIEVLRKERLELEKRMQEETALEEILQEQAMQKKRMQAE
ncbi:hypothetical protein C8A00DRAFT_34531 [Chaetomidium leptoderma]|uniref:Uncharacterized protein n=1 Tax=Chaetomidium leptoderma TaxID=669021 RepID=A0AAN6VJL6_9PEZI|nr:hypothetical protein C8A00DRAFT_34531 [Chaetomidium leptoderma]